MIRKNLRLAISPRLKTTLQISAPFDSYSKTKIILKKIINSYKMSSTAGASFQDRTLNKVAFCSAVFAGFAYVGYSYARTAFCRKISLKNGEKTVDDAVSHVVFRRLSQTTQTDALLGNLDTSGSGRLIIRPKTVQERIRELNVKARQFTDAFIAIQKGNDHSINAITRSYAMHIPNSVQCSPWNSPRLLSPVDVKHLISSQSTENLTCIPPDSSPSRPKWVRRNLQRKKLDGWKESELDHKHRLEEEAVSLLQNIPADMIERLDVLGSSPSVLTPYEAKCLVSLLYSRNTKLIEKALVTIANCAAFSVNLDFLREVGCIYRLYSLLQDPEVRLPAVQTLGNVILSEENIRQARDCLPLLMEFVQASDEDEGLKLASLIVLTNLATTSEWHKDYCPLLYKLYQFVDSANPHMQLQILRLLVNLACNKDMIPSLLAAEGSRKLGYLISMETSDPLLLRTLTLLATLSSSVKFDHIDLSFLNQSSEEKAASPDTTIPNDNRHSLLAERFSRLFGVGVREQLLVKAHEIMLHHNDLEISRQASKLCEALKDE